MTDAEYNNLTVDNVFTIKNTDSYWVDFQCTQNPPGAGLLQIDRGIVCLKDIAAEGGSLFTDSPSGGTGGGAIFIGSGNYSTSTPPCIVMTNASFPTLYLFTNVVSQAPANMNLGGLTANGAIKSSNNGVGYYSYFGGGGGGNSGGLCLDEYMNACFVGGTSSNYWCVRAQRNGNVLFAVGYSNWVSVLSLSGSGTRTVYAMSNGVLTTSGSSQRYKENIAELTDCSWIYDITPVSFDWIDPERKKTDGRQIGLIAENVYPLCPEMAWTDSQGRPDGVQYEKLAVPLLVEIKKLNKRIEAIEKQLKNQTAA